MYSAYFDESGHSSDSSYLVVAGALSTDEQWSEFEREWVSALDPFGTKIFHATDFEEGKSPFENLGEQAKNDLFGILVGIVRRRVERHFSRAILMSEYRATNDKYIFAEAYGYPYPLCARSCFNGIQQWASNYSISIDDILWFLEDGAQHKGQLQWIAERDRLPDPIFRKKKELIPLQCGDLLAWLHNMYLTKTTANKSINPRYKRALDLLYSASSDWTLLTMQDPDRLPTILSIPRRDESLSYRYRVIKLKGRRTPVLQYWPKSAPQPRVIKNNLELPNRMPEAEVLDAARKYDAGRTFR